MNFVLKNKESECCTFYNGTLTRRLNLFPNIRYRKIRFLDKTKKQMCGSLHSGKTMGIYKKRTWMFLRINIYNNRFRHELF